MDVKSRVQKEIDTAKSKDPKMDMTHLQWQLKQNSEDISSYITELNSWQHEIDKKDKSKEKRNKGKVSGRGDVPNRYYLLLLDLNLI